MAELQVTSTATIWRFPTHYFPAPSAKLRGFWSSHETCPQGVCLDNLGFILQGPKWKFIFFFTKWLNQCMSPPTLLPLPDTLTRFPCPDRNKLILSNHSNYDVTFPIRRLTERVSGRHFSHFPSSVLQKRKDWETGETEVKPSQISYNEDTLRVLISLVPKSCLSEMA